MSAAARQDVLGEAAAHLAAPELRRLRARDAEDRRLLSVRVELRVLLSAGVAMVGTGVAWLIERHVADLRLLLTLLPLVVGGVLVLASLRLRRNRSFSDVLVAATT